MSNKIVKLESISLMDREKNGDDMFQTTRNILVGHPYNQPYFDRYTLNEHHSNRDVVSIELVESLLDSDGCAYFVKLKDGHELRLPVHAFIAETEEVTDDEQ